MDNTTQIQRKAGTKLAEKSDVSTEISKVTISVVAIFGVAVGVWSLACIVGGLAASGGPLALVGAWMKAVTGM